VTRKRPTPIQGIDHAVQIGTGNTYTCALVEDGQVSCWGRGRGVLGDGISLPRATPTRVAWEPRLPRSRGSQPPVRAVSVAILDRSTCALREDGTVWCWGDVDAEEHSWPEPHQVPGITDAVKLETTIKFNAVDRDGVVFAWQPGHQPVVVERAISAVHEDTFHCVLGFDHVVTCGSDGERFTIRHVMQLAISHDPICVVQENRSVSCFSSRGWRELVALRGATRIALGDLRGCARLSWGEATCWDASSMWARPIDLRNVVEVFVGRAHACARTEAGRIWCWEPDKPSVEVPELFGARTVAIGSDHWCAVLDGDVVCKGSNQSGELGDGTNVDHDTWMRVAW